MISNRLARRSLCLVNHRDQGWSWVVLVTSFIAAIFCDGSISGFGVIYKYIQNDTHFKARNYTNIDYSLPGAIQSSCYVIAIGLAGPLANTFGFQWVGCIGGVTAGLSMFAGAFVEDLYVMAFLYGALSGLGLGVLCLCSGVGVTYYFEHFLGVAVGISAAGNGVGYIVVPAFLSFLSRYFGGDLGWRSALMVYGAVVTVTTFFCALSLKPLEIEPLTEEDIEEIEQNEFATNSHLNPGEPLERFSLQGISDEVGVQNYLTETFASVPWISGGHLEGKERSKHHKLWEKVNRGENGIGTVYIAYEDDVTGLLKAPDESIAFRSSNPEFSSATSLPPSYLHLKNFSHNVHSVIASSMDRPDSITLSNICVLSTIHSTDYQTQNLLSRTGKWLVRFFDLAIFIDQGFIIICTSCVVAQLAFFVPFTYFFSFATIQAGFSENDALLMGTIMGIFHTFGRFFGGAIANIPRVDIIIVTAVSCILCAICHLALPFLPYSFTILSSYCAGFGFLCAVTCPLQALLFVRFLGVKRLTMAVSNSCLIKAVTAAIGLIVAVKLNDYTGNLDGTFYFCGVCSIGSGLILFLLYLPCVKEICE